MKTGISRLYGGIHFTNGDVNGQILGEQVAQAVWDTIQFFINGINVGTPGKDLITRNEDNNIISGKDGFDKLTGSVGKNTFVLEDFSNLV